MRWWVLGVILAVGCEPFPQNFPGEVEGLRILAIAAEPPEAPVGDTSNLNALIEPPERAAVATFDWFVCEPLVISQVEGLGLDESICADPAGWSPANNPFSIPDLGNPGGPFFAPLVLRIEEGGDQYWSLKRLYISDATPANENPIVDAVVIDKKVGAGVVEVPRGTAVGLQTEATDGSDDEMDVEYFVTGGHIEDNDSSDLATSKTWITPSEPGDVEVYAVVRDGRGGTGWLSRTARVQ